MHSGPVCHRNRCPRNRSSRSVWSSSSDRSPRRGVLEAAEYRLPKDVPFRGMYLADRAGAAEARPHDQHDAAARRIRSALEYARSGDLDKARALSNPELAPPLANRRRRARLRDRPPTPDTLETEFVCVPGPIERGPSPDGGPLRYRVSHRARLWKRGERPALEQRVLEGAPDLSI